MPKLTRSAQRIQTADEDNLYSAADLMQFAAKAGTTIGIEIRGKQAPAIIVPKPIYRKT